MSRVNFLPGRGGLPKLTITTDCTTAEVYLHGAQVTHFQKHGEPPLLFLSEQSRFEPDVPIRGGIPIIFPWFGKPADKPAQHGFARNRPWSLRETAMAADGTVSMNLALPPCHELADGITVEYVVSVCDTLSAELIVRNKSAQDFVFENCLHTYFAIGDINSLRVAGLQGVDYLDTLDHHQRKTETADAIHFAGEVDRIYINTPHPVEIHDPASRRIVRVEKTGSTSTVIWNPWIAKAKAMADFGDEEYQRMVCVESGNVAENRLRLAPGATASLKVKLSSEATR